MNFDDAFARVLGHEGGLSMDPNDRGNWTSGVIGVGELRGTKFGISAMTYPTVDIANLTVDGAKEIYRRDFWAQINGDEMYDGVAFQAFDFAVNSSCQTAIRYLQRAIGVADDGDWGPITRAAAAAMTESDIIMRFVAERIDYWTRVSTWPKYGKSWARRGAQDLRYGAEDSD